MRVGTLVPDLQYAMQQTQQALSDALQQVSTGLRVSQPSDDPAAAANEVNSLADSASVDQYTKNVTAVTAQMQAADSAISAVVTSLNSAVTLGTSGSGGSLSPANKQALAVQVMSVQAGIVSQANLSYQGIYLFGGSETATPPYVPASTTYTSTHGSVATPLTAATALTAGSVTTVSNAATGTSFIFTATAGQTIADFSTAIANAAASGALPAGTTATIDAGGQLSIDTNSAKAGIAVSSTDPALGPMLPSPGTEVAYTYAYVGNSTVNNVQVGNSLSIATNLPGSQVFTGTNVIGSLTGLITALQGGTALQITAATGLVSKALTDLGQQRVPLDSSINQLSEQESYLGQETVSLTSQQNSLVGINLSVAATSLAQAELDNSAVLAAAAKVLPQTLLNYLSPG